MTVLVKNFKSVTHPKQVTKSRGATSGGLAPNEINEFNLQTNKERKKVKICLVSRAQAIPLQDSNATCFEFFFPIFFHYLAFVFFLAF